jgi:hypothetical protein
MTFKKDTRFIEAGSGSFFFNNQVMWYEVTAPELITYNVNDYSEEYQKNYSRWDWVENAFKIGIEKSGCHTYIWWIEPNGNKYVLPKSDFDPHKIMYKLNKEGMKIL